MYKSAKEVFDANTRFKVDNGFCNKVLMFVVNFINFNDNHTEFFGGALLGVHPIAFGNTRDGKRWLEEILGIEDMEDCQLDLTNTPNIDKNFHVSSNVVTQSFVYTCHRVLSSNLKEEIKYEVAKHLIFIMHARWLTGMMKKRFPYPTDPSIALALFESLDDRTDLKMTGSWYNLLMFRAITILDETKGIHVNVFREYSNDLNTVRAINDLEGRLSKSISALTEKFYIIRDTQSRILESSSMNDIDGEMTLREYRSSVNSLKTDIDAIAKDQRDFIKEELIGFTKEATSTCDVTLLRQVLLHYTDNYQAIPTYPKALESIVVYIYNMSKSGNVKMDDIGAIVAKMTALFRSSGTKKDEVVLIKSYMSEIVENAIPKARDNLKVGTRISLMIYLVLRILTIHRYR